MKTHKISEQQQAANTQANISQYTDDNNGGFSSASGRSKGALALNMRDNAAMAKTMGAVGSAMIGKTPNSDGRETGSQAAHAKLALKYTGSNREMEIEVLPNSGLEAQGGHYGAAGQGNSLPARKTRGTKKVKIA